MKKILTINLFIILILISFNPCPNTLAAQAFFHAVARDHMRPISRYYDVHEHEMPWARAACELWKMRQSEFGTEMFYQCGALSFRTRWTARTTAERAGDN